MNPVVKISHLTVRYDEYIALSNVCLDVAQNEFLGIIGPNGGGKSTLLKAILGLVPITDGEVEVMGSPATKKRNRIGYVPQFAVMDRKFPISVLDVVLTGRLNKIKLFKKYNTEDMDIAYDRLKLVGLGDLANRQISELSGGQLQRVLIARALAVDTNLLLLDEPTASVDAVSKEEIYNLLKKLNETMTIILVTHDMMAVSSEVKKIACLNRKLVYHGETMLNADIVNELYGCPVELIAHGVPHRVLRKHSGVNQL